MTGAPTADLHLATLGRLTRGALHEIANPLVALVGSAELALADLGPGTRLHARIGTVHATALEIANIVRALQGFARLQQEPPRRLSVADAAVDAVALVRLVGATPGVEISARAEGDARVHEAPGAVSRALVGLLLDALVEADGGEIELVVREDDGDAIAAVVGGGEARFPTVEGA